MKKEIILITGGAGFIGSHTADALAKRGYKVRIMDNLEPVVHKGKWPRYVKNKGYELLRGDVRDKRDWQRALRGVSYVYHVAAYQDQMPDFSKFFEVNTVGTALLYELIAGKKLPVKKVILAGTQFVYGDGLYQCTHHRHPMSQILTIGPKDIGCPEIGMPQVKHWRCFYADLRTEDALRRKRWDILCPHLSSAALALPKLSAKRRLAKEGGKPARFLPFREDQEPQPTNAYGLSKLASERLALRFGKTHKIPTTVLRYSIVQGARQSPHNLYSGAIRIFVAQALAGRPITVYEDGIQERDFVNIKDVVAANLLVLKNKKTNFETYNVGGGRAYRVLDFAKLVKRITGSGSRIKIGGYRRTDTRHAASDISKIKKLGWRPRFGPEDSVREYLEWYKVRQK